MGIKVTEADRQFSLVVRAKAGNECEHCGIGDDKQLQCCHLIGRRAAVTRWDLLNAVCMCSNCHRYFGEHPKHFVEWIKSQWPDRWDILYEKYQHPVSGNADTRKEVSAHYRGELKRLNAEPDYSPVSWI